jgi:hypothetical protein
MDLQALKTPWISWKAHLLLNPTHLPGFPSYGKTRKIDLPALLTRQNAATGLWKERKIHLL